MPATWWLHNRQLKLFMVRELTSVFVAGYAVLLLVMVWRRGQDRSAFQEFFQALGSAPSIVLQLIALAFVLYHCVTWFNLTPKVIILRQGEEKVSPVLIAGAHYALWLIVSILVLLVVL